MSDSLGEHRLPRSRGSIQEHTSGWINANLLVELMVSQRKLYSLTNLLFLNIASTNILLNKNRGRWSSIILLHLLGYTFDNT